MSPLDVKPGERGQVRLFLIPEEMADDLQGGLAPLEAAIGGIPLDPADVQVVPLKNLGEMSVRDFLSEAYDIDPETLPPRLDEAEGHLAILRSAAFPEDGTTLTPGENMGFLGLYAERSAAPPSQAALDALRSEEEPADLGRTAAPAPPVRQSRGSVVIISAILGAVAAALVVLVRTFM